MSEFRGPADNQPNLASRRCPNCQELQRSVLTTHVRLYYRCANCAHGWSEANPGKWTESLTGQTEITVDALAALVREAAACLREIGEGRNRRIVESGTNPPGTLTSVNAQDLAATRAMTARVRTLLRQHTELEYQTEDLFKEGEALRYDDHHGRDTHRHKVRQHHARLQAHLTEVRILLADLPERAP